MKRQTIIIALIILSLNSFSQKWQALNSITQSQPETEVLSSTSDAIVLRFNLDGYETQTVFTPRGAASVVKAPKMAPMLEEGAPELPVFAVPVVIGDSDEMELMVSGVKYEDYTGVEIAPSKGNLPRTVDPATVPYRYSEVYSQNAFYPAQQAVLGQPYILRDLRGQNVMVYPFAYNPVTKVLRVYSEMTLTLRKNGENGLNPKTARKALARMSAATEAMYSRRFVNYRETASKYNFLADEGLTMVLCPTQFRAAMQPYVDWKNQSGRPTTLYSLDEAGGNNSAAIKEFIRGHYNNPEENLCHVLLVGDYDELTPHVLNGAGSDIWFGQLEGNDYYPEVFVGRFSAQSVADVEHQVAKVIYYERDMPADADWLGKGIGIGSTEGQGSGHNGGESDYQHIEYIRDTLLHYTYSEISQHYAGVGVGTNAAMLSENFNAGAGICNYCNHGSTTSWYVGSFSNSHVNALTNDYKWPFIWSTACLNGKFDLDCFAEAWMRATDNVTGVPTGAIGGMFSWTSQPWQPPMTGQDEMVDVLCEWRSTDHYHHTLAGASLNGNMKILDLYPSDQGVTHNTWILFGDPNLMLRTATPQPMNVSCQPEAILLGQNELHLSADVDCALATLSVDGTVLCSVPVINGEATLTFESPMQTGTAQLVVVGFNKVTHVQDIDIIPANGAYLTFDSYAVNTESGQADYGETFGIDLTVKNIGNETATNVQVSLSTDSPYVNIIDATVVIPNIAALEHYTLEDAFHLTVADLIDDGTVATFTLDFADGYHSWNSSFRMTLHAPVLALTDFRPITNITPGQNGTLVVSIRNDGTAASHNTRVELYSSSTDITFDQTSLYLWSIPAGETATAHFHFTTNGNILTGSSYEIMYIVEAEQYTLEGTGFLNIGAIKETFETGDFSVFDWNTLGGAYWYVDNSTANTGTYSVRSGDITHANLTTLQVTIDVTATGQISFYKKICTEADKDKLTFYIDGQTFGVWSGEMDWSHESFAVTAGRHTFRWIYMKDSSGSYGDDACWLDDIQFPAAAVIEIEPCPELQAFVDHNLVTLTWTNLGAEYEYIIRCNGDYVTTQSGTTYSEIHGDGICLYSVTGRRQDRLTAPSYVLVEVGIEDVEEMQNDISVYPNPTNGILFVEAFPTSAQYRVFNLTGQQIMSGTTYGSLRIDFIDQPKGVYVLQIVDGGRIVTKKIVVQ